MDREQAKAHLAFLRVVTPIIGAFARGEDVQSCTGTDGWRDAPNPSFKQTNGPHTMKWRVKPVPVKVEVWVCRADYTEQHGPGPDDCVEFKKGDKQLDGPSPEYASYWTKHELVENL